MKFNKDNTDDLKRFLYTSGAHDSGIMRVEGSYSEDRITVLLNDPYNKTEIRLLFSGIDLALSVKGREYGSNDTVNALTLEEDYQYLKNYLADCSLLPKDSLCLCFQMFSGSELHIVAKEVETVVVSALNS